MKQSLTAADAARNRVRIMTRADETACVAELLAMTKLSPSQRDAIQLAAAKLVGGMRRARRSFGNLDDFLEQYSLSTPEGIALMCIAEALLRIPDAATADALIEDKLASADWQSHLGESDNLFVNASTWALMLTGEVSRIDDGAGADPIGFLRKLTARLGEPVIRQAMRQAMRAMGQQFVIGDTIETALSAARNDPAYLHSFDMLGEGARTAADAERYYAAYLNAATSIAAAAGGKGPAHEHGMSVKLSALHPRYEWAQRRIAFQQSPSALSQLPKSRVTAASA